MPRFKIDQNESVGKNSVIKARNRHQTDPKDRLWTSVKQMCVCVEPTQYV